jgi:5'-3' exonuclease
MTGVPLLLVDGHNLLFRACFGTPAQIWSRDPDDKRELTTEFMFFALLRKGINEELPGWPEVVVVFDGQDGSAQRKETDSGYKANRPADDQALKPIRALPAVKAGLELFAITWVEISDAEAVGAVWFHLPRTRMTTPMAVKPIAAGKKSRHRVRGKPTTASVPPGLTSSPSRRKAARVSGRWCRAALESTASNDAGSSG